MRVFKFGGASVKDAEGVRNLLGIVSQTTGELLVVVSAMGKTTNALERIVETIGQGDKRGVEEQWKDLLAYHQQIASSLGLQLKDVVADDVLGTVMAHRNAKDAVYDDLYDTIVSIGELMSTSIVAAFLNHEGVKAQLWNMPELLITDGSFREAVVNMQASAQQIQHAWHNPYRPRVVIAQGFIGGTDTGHRTTLGREGSDYTAALVANFLDAEDVTIWKDVPGILNADPRLEPNTVLIPQLNYFEAVELAYSGAQVIHPKTIRPLENKHIPLYVRPFLHPEQQGTIIKSAPTEPVNVPVYIWRKEQVLITMRAKDFSFVLEDSLSHIFDVVQRCRLKVSLIQSSAVTISICVDRSRSLQKALQLLGEHYDVTYNEHLSLLTIRGTTPELIERERQGRTILLSQLTRRTAKFVIAG
ncbi:MAG: aspartate kinase [Paludibacteraceae bacterium]|nr:aspartate kinase [Paludibacteraceae bacterium]